jgi:hypothetical protein
MNLKRMFLITALIASVSHANTYEQDLAKLNARYALKAKREGLKNKQKAEREALKNRQKAERDALKGAR